MKEQEYKLFQVPNGKNKKFTNFYLVWVHDSKVYELSVQPLYKKTSSFSLLFATAIKCENECEYKEMLHNLQVE